MNSDGARLARFAPALLLGLLAACGGNTAQDLPPQHWHDLEVSVESRPSPPRPGANEFLVMVTNSRGRPAYNLVVSLRTQDSEAWKQAIEDGQVGVYRTAVKIEPGAAAVLQVQVRAQDGEGVLKFPLQVQP